jgi:hypothetical protein
MTWLIVVAYLFVMIALMASSSRGMYARKGLGFGGASALLLGGGALFALTVLTHGMLILIPLALIIPGKLLDDYLKEEKGGPPKS